MANIHNVTLTFNCVDHYLCGLCNCYHLWRMLGWDMWSTSHSLNTPRKA